MDDPKWTVESSYDGGVTWWPHAIDLTEAQAIVDVLWAEHKRKGVSFRMQEREKEAA